MALFAAGAVTDSVKRTGGQALLEVLGRSIVTENEAGAQRALRVHPVDGFVRHVRGEERLPHEPLDLFPSFAGIGSTAMTFIVPEASPIKSSAD